MIHVVESFHERLGLKEISNSLRKQGYTISDVWADSSEVPTCGLDREVDSVWFAGEVIQKLADMCAADVPLIGDHDIVIFDAENTVISEAIKTLFKQRDLYLVEYRNGDLYYQDRLYQPLDLMKELDA